MPLQAIKNGLLKERCILYNAANQHMSASTGRFSKAFHCIPLLSKLHQHHTGRGLLPMDKAVLVDHLVCDTFTNPADSKLDNLHVFQL